MPKGQHLDHELRMAIIAGWANGLLQSQMAADLCMPVASVGQVIHVERSWAGKHGMSFYPDIRRERARRGKAKNEKGVW